MEFRILGALEAGSGATLVDLGSPKQRALFAVLLLHVGEIVPIDRLVDLIWGDDPPRTAEHSIQIYVSELRKALEPAFGDRLIHLRQPGYQLDVPRDSVDANRFQSLVQEGSELLTAGERDEAITTLREALALWRGPALSDFAYEDFAQPYVRRLNDLHLDAIEQLASAELDAGTPASAISLLEAAIRDDPLREHSRELLMLALYRTGRHPEALRTYDRLRDLLVEELGLEPSPALQQLRDRVLLHDPTLMPTDKEEPAHAARNPYKGLKPFSEHDAQDFFGREALVEQLLAALRERQRFVALVGPSGSGKSSVAFAGLIPKLRRGEVTGSEDWRIAAVSLGPDPVGEVRAVLKRLGPPAEKFAETALPFPDVAPGSRLVLVMDQFEQLFNVGDDARRNEFLAALAAALQQDDGRITVVVTLRADFYDRPMQRPEISDLFVRGVVHVLPMTAHELEAAILEPAQQVGVGVEPGLAAELVAETVSHPGSLPLLQYALTELFEQRGGSTLTHAGYMALGGLRGVLTRRAEAAFLGLDAEQQKVATQVFLRLVRPGRGTADSRRRISVAELTDLADDSVALSAVVTAFGRHRLLTFDHDPATGKATVELAHEALLTEWDRLSGWIDRHRAALRRRDALLHAVDEWELADRNPDYLLTGSRLDEFTTWSRDGGLQLTSREQAFLDAGLEQRQTKESAAAETEAQKTRLARTARLRLLALGAAVFLFSGVAAFAFLTAPPPPLPPVAYMFDDSGTVNSIQIGGFDRAVADEGLVGRKFSWDDVDARVIAENGDATWISDRESDEYGEHWMQAADDMLDETSESHGLIVTFGMAFEYVESVAQQHLDTYYTVGPAQGSLPNVAYQWIAYEEPSYLAGVAAAHTSKGKVGFIGAVDNPLFWGFQAGFEAGVRATDPQIDVDARYLSADDFNSFVDDEGAHDLALEMYRDGADVIFHAAGQAGIGVFEAATEYSRSPNANDVWAIGVDEDQYMQAGELPGSAPDTWKEHILSSVRLPIAEQTEAVIRQYAAGEFISGNWHWGLAEIVDLFGDPISFSGDYISDMRPELEVLAQQIIAGEIVPPCVPEDRLEWAAETDFPLDYCR